MTDYRYHSVNQSELLNRVIRAIIIIVVSFLASITFVSFAVHHMRLQFEEEFEGIADKKIEQVSEIVKMTIHGDEIVNNKILAAEKYNNVLNLMIADNSSSNMSTESYVLFAYSEGSLEMLLSKGADSSSNFVAGTSGISEWLNADYSSTIFKGDKFESVIVPIADSEGRCVGVFEYKVSYNNLSTLGDSLEARILTAVIIAVSAGILLFIIQITLPRIIVASRKGGQHL